jgi:hypothetical protein
MLRHFITPCRHRTRWCVVFASLMGQEQRQAHPSPGLASDLDKGGHFQESTQALCLGLWKWRDGGWEGLLYSRG